jgi:hypothetical protein
MHTDTPIRNPRWNAGNEAIDCEIEHPTYGWIPFTASPHDVEPHGRAIFDAAKSAAAPYEPPAGPTPEEILAAERAPMVVSRFQAKAALLGAGLLDQVNAALAEADPVAQLAWAEAVEFRRTSPTILGLAVTIGLTDEQLDELFRAAAQIEA